MWRLGAPEQAPIERAQIRRYARNLMRVSLEPAAAALGPEGGGAAARQRYPALLEFVFDSRPGKSGDSASVELADPRQPASKVRVHGRIDRIDLLFDAAGRLDTVAVIDYKGKSKAQQRPAELAAEIAAARDCQLPVYGLAAAACFGGVSVLMQYLSYSDPLDAITKQAAKNWIALDGRPVPPEDLKAACGERANLLDAFQAAVFDSLARYERGEFAIRPAECAYCGFRSCCRYAESLLPAASGGEEGAS